MAGGLPAEERTEDVAHAEAAAEQILEVHVAAAVGAAAACRARHGSEAIVLRALRRIGQHVVRFVELFELVLGIGSLVYIGVQLARATAKRLLDFVFVRIPRHSQNFVQILGHLSLKPFFTSGRTAPSAALDFASI